MDLNFFAKIIKEPTNSLIEKAIDDGGIPIGYTCSLVPEVVLSLPPLFPVRLRAPGVGGTEIADIYQSNLTCSYTRSLLEFAMDFRYDFLGGWVHAASCDHLRRLHDNLEYLTKPDFIHILDVPHRTGETALAWLTDELLTLLEKLETHFKVDISNTALLQAIKQHNDFLQTLSHIGDLRKKDIPALSGTEFHKIMIAAISSPKNLIKPRLHDIYEHLSQRETVSPPRVKLMLVGGQMDDPRYIEAIESTGALVVADRICTGSIPGLKPIAPITDLDNDPVRALAAHILETPSCPRMMEDFDKRLSQIITTAKEYRVDGIIIEWIKFCDTWGVEISTLAPALRENGYRVLCLEREYRHTGEGQLQTRVQAFVESLEAVK